MDSGFTTSSEEDRIGELLRAALFIQRVPSSVEPDVFPADIADSQNLKGPQSGMVIVRRFIVVHYNAGKGTGEAEVAA